MNKLIILIILISGFVFSQETMLNIGSEKNERLSTILKTDDGSFYVFGQRGNCDGALSPCNGSSQEDNIDPIIYKFNSNLELEWSKEYQREYIDVINSATIYNNHIYITGTTIVDFVGTNFTDRDFLVVKMDLEGNIIWSKRFGGVCNGTETYCGDVAKKITIHNDIIFVSGYYAFAGTGLYDAAIIKINLDGDLIEERIIDNGMGSNLFLDATTTPGENIIYTGYSKKNGSWEPWLHYEDQQNNVLFSNTYGDQSTNSDIGFKTIFHDQNFYMLTTYSGQYVNLNKVDENGDLVWSKKFEGNNARDILVYNNEIFIAVINNYQNTLGVLKIDTNGNLIQQKQFVYMGGGSYPVQMEIINNQLIVAGTIEYISNGYDDVYLMTIDSTLEDNEWNTFYTFGESALCLENNEWGTFYIEENDNVFQSPIGHSEFNITSPNYDVNLTQTPLYQNISSNFCGCIDNFACNYNPEATISTFCEYESCAGCADPEACNYNQEAIEDDGTCEYIELDLGEDIVTCEDFVVIDAGGGHDSYIWSTGETTQTIEVSESGNYSVSVQNNENQNNYSMSFSSSDDNILLDGGVIQSYPLTMMVDVFVSEYLTDNIIISKDNTWAWYIRNFNGPMQLSLYNNTVTGDNWNYYQFNENQWYTIAITIDENGNMIQYVDGENISEENDSFTDPWGWGGNVSQINFSNNESIRLGRWNVGNETNDNFLNGSLDNIKIWNYALSSQEIIDNQNCGTINNQNNLLGHWTFEEGPEEGQVIDFSGYGNNGIINNTTYNVNSTEEACQIETCSDSDEINITFSPQGCTDDNACNYNSNAICDDESCEYIEEVNLGEDINTCAEFITLDAGEGYGSYLWSTGEASQIIEITESGDYSVDVESGNANNYSMYFDNNDNIEITPENVINELDSYTFNAWVKIDDTNTFQPIFWIGNTDESELEIYTINSFTPAGAGLRVAHKRANPELFNYNIFTPIETSWVFLSVVFNEGLVSVYFNNQEQSILDDGNEILFSNVSVSDIRIGYQDAGSGTQAINLNGSLDEVSFFNNALNHNERENIMNCSPTGDEEGLIGYWNFEEGAEGGQVIDVSGNGNNGNINNATYDDEVPTQECLTNCESTGEINVIFNICGCMDSSADNFNPIASEDDGGCEYLGCMNPSACNFNPTANIDDGTCQLCSSREFNDGAYLDVDSEIINAQGLTISFWVNSDDFCENPSQFSTYIDFGSQETYRYVVRNRSCKIEAFFEGDMLPTDFDWGEMDWDYPKASAAGSLVPNGEQAGWRQVTTVFCPTTIRIYIDGEIVASNGTGVYFQEGFNLFEEDIKRIGSNQIDYEPANAIIDEVRVWNRALSGEEVLARSSTTTTLNTTEELNLNGYWKMDCDNPFLNEITNQQAVESLVVGTSVNENFNNNNCETNIEYNYDCSLDFEGNPDCNSCDPPEGCTDEEACNYDYLAIIPINDACFYVPDYCSGLEYPEYYDCDCKCINDVDVDDVCDELEVDGCSEDESACNYNPEGTQPCVFSIDLYPSGLYDCEGVCYNDNDPPTNNEGGVGDGICDEIDNCPDTYNPNQTDLNEDGIGDDCDGVGLYENSALKNLIKIVDVLGREIKEKTKNTILIYIYDNGEIIPSYNF